MLLQWGFGAFLLAGAVVLVLCGLSQRAPAAPPNDGLVTVTIIVESVPEATPNQATLYLTGNHASLGPWRPAGRALEQTDDDAGRWRTALRLPDGFQLEFKITRGTWDTVEKGARGEEIDNRVATANEDDVIHINVAAWADGGRGDSGSASDTASSITGNVEVIEAFRSDVLNNERRIVVYLPPGYREEPHQRYPVLYMHDGHNLFDRSTAAFGVEWEADETAERLIAEGEIEPLIIVGIYTNKNRLAELSDVVDAGRSDGGRGAEYAHFLVHELKPHIDEAFRTKPGREHTGVAGSSLGGLMSLYLVERHPEVFSRCAAVSPALRWGDEALTRRWRASPESLPLDRTKFWIDVGTAELVADVAAASYVQAVERLVNVLRAANLNRGEDYEFVIDDGAAHNEAAWSRRFPDILRFLFPAEPQRAIRHFNSEDSRGADGDAFAPAISP
ncbi:MAG: alpha/beta hydrolase-fold protein [Planctomycetota bacterium]